MAEKDATVRLRRAVKENNLFLVKRLVQRTDMRNPDPAPRRFTSLAWAAVLGHEETFEYLLAAGHDDDELSKDSEGNTILMLLADTTPTHTSSYASSDADTGRTLRMVTLYYDRYPEILDWSNALGKTALHIAALKGNEELVRMLCDLGADYDLADNEGNTSLHFASTWGHIPVVQLLIERGCQYAARNNEGFTASDYAYSYSTKETLQETARAQFEFNKRSRRGVYAQAAARGNEWGGSAPVNMPAALPLKARDMRQTPSRMRSGSGTSRTTTTSDSGELDGNLAPGHMNGHSQMSASSSPSQPSASTSGSVFHGQQSSGNASSASTGTFSVPSPGQPPHHNLHPVNPAAALSPIATRMRERDADAMEKYLRRNRSSSASTDNKSANGSNVSSAGPSANGDDITSLPIGAASTPRKRLRPSMSAAQLRTQPSLAAADPSLQEGHRNRSGTNPNNARPNPLPLGPVGLSRSSSQRSHSSRSMLSRDQMIFAEEPESFAGPPSQYANFPGPPSDSSLTTTPTLARRTPFNLMTKPLPSIEQLDSRSISHRRGSSISSIRGAVS
ncbi:hypothetical protein PLICRDRAFT_98932 [Plicaturopsis crispa FD-325 SS-3]|nr:hypothetical protein PLICRDRAFT_98932 [Plicaturopsis crispa FD-325 SS-3]